MPLLIDGHNLIGQLPGIDLADPDDERQLIELLRSYCARTGRRATVYFDNADLLSRDPRPQAGLTVHFVAPAHTADEAIRDHLLRLGRAAKNWSVVSSDRSVRRAARGSGATVVRAEDFARQLHAAPTPDEPPEKPAQLEPDEIEEWLRLFSEDSTDRPE